MLSRKPTNPVLDKSHPLARGLVGAWPFSDVHGTTFRDLGPNGLIGSLTNGVGARWVRRYGDLGFKTSVVSERIVLCSATDIPVDGNATFIIDFEKDDATNRVSGLWGNFSSTIGERVGAHLPYEDGIVYWDYGGNTSGTTRLTYDTGGASWYFNRATWAFTVGPRGMEIWRNGVKLAGNTATPTRTTSATDFGLNRYAGTNGDLVTFFGFVAIDRQLEQSELVGLRDGLSGLYGAGDPRVVAAVPSTGGGYTPDLTLDGWTTIPSVTSGIEIYVDATAGSDSNDGLSSSAPKKTISAAVALMTSGQGDHLLLKRGEQWAETINVAWSGGGPADPVVITGYGSDSDPAPKITRIQHLGGTERDYVWVVDVYLSEGASLLSGGSGWRLEGLLLTNNDGLSTEGSIDIQCIDNAYVDFAVHRCVICDAHTDLSGGHQQGMYVAGLSNGITNLSVTECVFEHNGHDGWDGAIDAGHEATVFNHNVYVQYDCGDSVAFRKNWIGHGSSHGIQLRCGGVLEDNLFVGNPISMLVGNSYGLTESVQGVVQRNVVVDGADIDGSGRGWFLDVESSDDCAVLYNIACNNVSGSSPSAVAFGATHLNVTGARLKGNITYKWGAPWRLADGVGGISLEGNDIQEPAGGDVIQSYPSGITSSANNRYYTTDADGSRFAYNGSAVTDASWKSSVGDSGSAFTDLSGVYTAPDRTLGDYAVSIGMADETELLTAVRAQRKGNWDLNLTPDRINAYFRANFDMIPAPSSFTATKDGVDVDLESTSYTPESDSFVFQRSPNGVDTWTQIATPTSPSATDTNPGTGTWYYRCAAVVDAVTGDWSDVASVTFAAAGTGGRKPLGLRPGRLL